MKLQITIERSTGLSYLTRLFHWNISIYNINVPKLAGSTACGFPFRCACWVMRTTSFTGIQSGLLPGNVPGDREIAESLEGNKSWDSWTKSTACFPVVIEVGSVGWNDTAVKIQNQKIIIDAFLHVSNKIS